MVLSPVILLDDDVLLCRPPEPDLAHKKVGNPEIIGPRFLLGKMIVADHDELLCGFVGILPDVFRVDFPTIVQNVDVCKAPRGNLRIIRGEQDSNVELDFWAFWNI